MTELMIANSQWSARPNDQRFISLEELEAAVRERTERSSEAVVGLSMLHVEGNDQTGLVSLPGESGPIDFSHYSFGQFCSRVHAPAAYLRQLPPHLVAQNLNYGLTHRDADEVENAKMLYSPALGQRGDVRAFTSETYGRIWDIDVVRKVQQVNVDGNWQIPAASYATHDPKRATTLYASDHDCWMFLVDPEHPIEVPSMNGDGGDTLFRGFVAFNSEVGDRTFGLITFLYRYVCDNRIIWGAEDVSELLIRHTKGGPYRFEEEAVPVLRQYADASTIKTVAQIEAAKTAFITELPSFEPKEYELAVSAFLKDKGFGGPAVVSTMEYLKTQGNGPTVWDTVQGLTTFAHTIAHTDTRIDLERRASSLMALVADR